MRTATPFPGRHGRKVKAMPAPHGQIHGRPGTVKDLIRTADPQDKTATVLHGKTADRRTKAVKAKAATDLPVTAADRHTKAVKDKAAVAHLGRVITPPGTAADRRTKAVKVVPKVAPAKGAQAAHRVAVPHTKAAVVQVAHQAQVAVVLPKAADAQVVHPVHAKTRKNRKPRPEAISAPFGTANSTSKPLALKRTGRTALATKTATP